MQLVCRSLVWFTAIVVAGAPASARPAQWYFPVPTSPVYLVLAVLWLVAVLVVGLGLEQLGSVRWACPLAPDCQGPEDDPIAYCTPRQPATTTPRVGGRI
jgi:hypothetical protein